MGKVNSTGHFLPRDLDLKINQPPVYSQWIWIFNMLTEPRHIITMGHMSLYCQLAREGLCVAPFTDIPDIKVHGANLGPIWGRQDPGGPHFVPINFVVVFDPSMDK